MLRIYKQSDDDKGATALRASLSGVGINLLELRQERCFTVELSSDAEPLSSAEEQKLMWLVAETFEPGLTGMRSTLDPLATVGGRRLLEVGPRLTFCTAWSSNAVGICHACGLTQVTRVECFRRYLLRTAPELTAVQLKQHAESVHDRMTECVYDTPLASFQSDAVPAAVRTVPLLARGRVALEEVSAQLGLGFD